jgi:hypothetical protein
MLQFLYPASSIMMLSNLSRYDRRFNDRVVHTTIFLLLISDESRHAF